MRLRTLLFIGLCVALLASAAYFLNAGFGKRVGSAAAVSGTQTPMNLPVEDSSASPARPPPSGSLEYHSNRYHFSIFYPQGMQVSFFDEGAGAGTFTFQNVQAAQGFQVFVVPYGGNRIDEDRFHRDEPSGVRTGMREASVDGALAAVFYSTSASLGGTYEIWFIHDGLLYEVTTLKPLDTQLDGILGSWRFI